MDVTAIYARKSTEERGTSNEAKSVTRQVEHGRAFAAKQGWRVDDAHIYVDDGISGAEFDRRPGLQRMLADAKAKRFKRVIVSEQKSLGREAFETNSIIKTLSKGGMDIVEYASGTSLVPRNATDKVLSTVRSFGDEVERERSSQRTTEALEAKFLQGHVVGGRVFGYDNVDIFNGTDAHGRPLRSHVERRKNPAQEAVVVRIFELYDSGLGYKAIAIQLNRERAVRPAPIKRRDGLSTVDWSETSVRAILLNSLYCGEALWKRTKKRNDWGEKDQKARPTSDVLRVVNEDWRIVPEDLWLRVQARRREAETRALRMSNGRLVGRPPKTPSQNLLAGQARCGVCGGGIVVESSKRKGTRAYEYCCGRRRHTGMCSNALRVEVSRMNEAVLAAIEEHALTPEAVERVILEAERDDYREALAALDGERTTLTRKISRLTRLLLDDEQGGTRALVAEQRALEARLAALDAQRDTLEPLPTMTRSVVESRLEEWRRLLRQSTTQSRGVLQRILADRITFTPDAEGTAYTFTAPTRFDRLFTGVVARVEPPVPSFIDVNDTTGKDGIREEDTYEADYGRLLERAYRRAAGGRGKDGKVLASPPGFEPGFQP